MQVKVKRSDVVWSYLGTFFSLCSNLITIPLVVFFFDEEVLGLWNVFVAVGTIAILFDFGFTVTFARNITYCWSGARRVLAEGVEHGEEGREPDFALMKRICGTSRMVYLIVSVIALVLMLTVGTWYIVRISGDMEGYSHLVAWFIYTIGTFLNLYFNYYDSFLRGVGAVDAANKNRVISRIVHLTLMTALLLCGTGIIGASIAYLAYGLVFRLLGRKKFYAFEGIGDKLKAVAEKVSRSEMVSLFKTIWHNAWRDGLIHVASYACDSFSVVVFPLFLGLAESAVYSTTLQIGTAVAAMSSVLHIAYQPSIQAAYVKRDTGKLRDSISLIMFVYVVSFAFATLLAAAAGLPILHWLKPGMAFSIPLLLGICANQFLLMYVKCYTYYLSSTNRLIYMPAFVITAAACVGLWFLLLGPLHMGVWGIILAQVGLQLAFNAWYWRRFVHRELGLSVPYMYHSGKAQLVEEWAHIRGKLSHKTA